MEAAVSLWSDFTFFCITSTIFDGTTDFPYICWLCTLGNWCLDSSCVSSMLARGTIATTHSILWDSLLWSTHRDGLCCVCYKTLWRTFCSAWELLYLVQTQKTPRRWNDAIFYARNSEKNAKGLIFAKFTHKKISRNGEITLSVASMSDESKSCSCRELIISPCADPEGGGGQGVQIPPPWKSQNIGFPCNTGPDPLKHYKATKPAFNVGPSSVRQRNAISGVPLANRWSPIYSGIWIPYPLIN